MKEVILTASHFKPGDQPPDTYLAWMDWAEVQLKAGIKQVQCGICGLWKTPQELSALLSHVDAPVCNKCAFKPGI